MARKRTSRRLSESRVQRKESIAQPLVSAEPKVVSDIRAAKQEWSARLLAPTITRMAAARAPRGVSVAAPMPQRNVVGVAVAEKFVDGAPTGALGLTFFVRVKFPAAQLSRSELLPTAVNGIPIDVVEVGTFRALPAKTKRKSAVRAAASPGSRHSQPEDPDAPGASGVLSWVPAAEPELRDGRNFRGCRAEGRAHVHPQQ